MLSGEATNTNFIVFGLTRPGIDPTIYRNRGEHANNHTNDTFLTIMTALYNNNVLYHTGWILTDLVIYNNSMQEDISLTDKFYPNSSANPSLLLLLHSDGWDATNNILRLYVLSPYTLLIIILRLYILSAHTLLIIILRLCSVCTYTTNDYLKTMFCQHIHY